MADANGTWDDTRKGFHFYCDETKSGTVFLPAQGMRTYVNGKVVDYAKFGYYWTAGNAYRDHKPGPAPAPPADAPSCGHTMMFRGGCQGGRPLHLFRTCVCVAGPCREGGGELTD